MPHSMIRKRHLLVLSWLLLCSPPGEAQFQSVRVQIIDWGQADGILIRTPNERWVVIDAGTNRQQADAMRNTWGVDRVALAVVSHRHLDHAGGMDVTATHHIIFKPPAQVRGAPRLLFAAILTRKRFYGRGGKSSGPKIWRTSVSPSQPGQCCL